METPIETSWNDSVPPSFQSPVTGLSFLGCLAKISMYFCAVCHTKTSIWTTIFDEVDFGVAHSGMEPLKEKKCPKKNIFQNFKIIFFDEKKISRKKNGPLSRCKKFRRIHFSRFRSDLTSIFNFKNLGKKVSPFL